MLYDGIRAFSYALKVIRKTRSLHRKLTEGEMVELFGGRKSASGVYVTPNIARQASAVYACVRNTAETLASLPFILQRIEYDDKGRPRRSDARRHPLYSILLHQPNTLQTAFDYWEMVADHLELRGNHYSKIVRSADGQIAELIPMEPDAVNVQWILPLGPRVPAYQYIPPHGGRPETLMQEEVFHIRGPMQGDGLKGMDPITLHRNTIGRGLAVREYGDRFFANDARPGGALMLNNRKELPDKVYNRLRSQFNEKYGGENRHSVAIFEMGAEYKTVGLTNEQAQYLQSIMASDLEICRIFRMPPWKAGIIEKSTFNNVEHQNRVFATDKMTPLIRRVEAAIHAQLLTTSGRRSFRVTCHLDEILRGDIKTRTDHYTKSIQWGIYSPNDVREKMGENSIGPEGDKYLTPRNMGPMDELMTALTEAKNGGTNEQDDDDTT